MDQRLNSCGLVKTRAFQYRRTAGYTDFLGSSSVRFLAMACGARTLRTRWLALSLALVLGGVSGCGGGGGGGKILYAAGLGSPTVTTFAVSSAGALTAGGSVSTGSAPNVIGIEPRLRFAYVVDSAGGIGAGGVSQYVMNRSTGVLTVATFSSTNGTAAASTPVPTGVNPSAIAFDGSGTFVFVANKGSNSISVFTIDQVGGTLTEVKQPTTNPPLPDCLPNQIVPCPLATAAAPSSLAVAGSILLVANSGAGLVSAYPFNSSGALDSTKLVTTAIGGSPSAMAMDSSGKFLFITDPVASTVAAFSIGSSGQLSAVGAPLAAGTTPVSVRVHPSGNFLYTANQGSDNVSAFSFDSSGALTALSGSPFAAATGPSYVATDTSGSFLFVANRDSNNISVFSIDSGGALKPVTGSPFGPPVVGIVNPIALASIN